LAVSNLKVYVYEDMLALFAHKPYDLVDLSIVLPTLLMDECCFYDLHMIDDTLAHITNTCVQTEVEGFDENRSVKLFWELETELDDLISKKQEVRIQHIFHSKDLTLL